MLPVFFTVRFSFTLLLESSYAAQATSALLPCLTSLQRTHRCLAILMSISRSELCQPHAAIAFINKAVLAQTTLISVHCVLQLLLCISRVQQLRKRLYGPHSLNHLLTWSFAGKRSLLISVLEYKLHRSKNFVSVGPSAGIW